MNKWQLRARVHRDPVIHDDQGTRVLNCIVQHLDRYRKQDGQMAQTVLYYELSWLDPPDDALMTLQFNNIVFVEGVPFPRKFIRKKDSTIGVQQMMQVIRALPWTQYASKAPEKASAIEGKRGPQEDEQSLV